MSATKLADVSEQIQKFWSSIFMQELREKHILGSLVNKDYEGEIKRLGDTVYVSQVQAPTGSMRTVGVDADSYESEKLVTKRIPIVADKRATAAFELEELVDLQSQIGSEQSQIRDALMFSIMRQINNHLFSKVNPSTSAPDHLITGVTDFNATQLNLGAKLASQAKWSEGKAKWALVDPSYASDLRAAQTLTSSDYVGDDRVVVGGKIATQRFGFNIIEDNSEGMQSLSATVGGGEDAALLFEPDFLHLVMQTEPRFKVSDLHGHKQFSYIVSCDIVVGAALGIDGDKKHIVFKN
jgi:hypothetical protein